MVYTAWVLNPSTATEKSPHYCGKYYNIHQPERSMKLSIRPQSAVKGTEAIANSFHLDSTLDVLSPLCSVVEFVLSSAAAFRLTALFWTLHDLNSPPSIPCLSTLPFCLLFSFNRCKSLFINCIKLWFSINFFFFFRKHLRNSLNCLEFTIVDLLYSRYTVDLLFWMWLSQNVATFTAKSLCFSNEGWPSFRSLFLGPENWYHNLGKDYSTSDGIKAKNSCSPNHIRMALLPFDYYQLEKQGFVDF